MAQVGGAAIDQQKGTEAGASGDDLGAPFSLSALCEEHTYSPPARGQRWYCLTAAVRPPGAAPLVQFFPAQYIPANANGGLCIGRSHADHRGLGGLQPPTSGTGYIPVHCLRAREIGNELWISMLILFVIPTIIGTRQPL